MKKNTFGIIALLIGYVYLGVLLYENFIQIFGKRTRDVAEFAFGQDTQLGASYIFGIAVSCAWTLVVLIWVIYATKNSEDPRFQSSITLGYRTLLLLYTLATTFLRSKWSMFFTTIKNNAETYIMMIVILLAWLALAKWQSRKGEIIFLILRLGAQIYAAKGFASTFRLPLFENGKFEIYNFLLGYVKDITGYLSIIFIVLYIVYPRIFKHD